MDLLTPYYSIVLHEIEKLRLVILHGIEKLTVVVSHEIGKLELAISLVKNLAKPRGNSWHFR